MTVKKNIKAGYGYMVLGFAASVVIVRKIIHLLHFISEEKSNGGSINWCQFAYGAPYTTLLLISFGIMGMDLWWQNKLRMVGRPIAVDIKPALIIATLGVLLFYVFSWHAQAILLLALPLMLLAAYGFLRMMFRIFEKN
jgi:hypothetical protein